MYNVFADSAKISVEQVMRMNEDKSFDYSALRDFVFSPVSFDEKCRTRSKNTCWCLNEPNADRNLPNRDATRYIRIQHRGSKRLKNTFAELHSMWTLL